MTFNAEITYDNEYGENSNGNIAFALPGFDESKLLIYREIFNGGFSSIVGARDLTSGSAIAVKKVEFNYLGNIFTPITDLQRNVLNKIRKQVNKIRELSKISVMKMLDFVSEPNKLVVVSEICLFGDLFNWMLQQHVLKFRDILMVVNSLFRAFDFLHSQGYIHGYLNPTSVLFQTISPHSLIIKPDLSVKKELAHLLNNPLIAYRSCTAPEELKKLVDAFEKGQPIDLIKEDDSPLFATKEMDVWSIGVIILIAFTGVNFFQFDSINDLRQPFDVKLEEAFKHPIMLMCSEKFFANLRKILAVDPSKRISAADGAAINWLEESKVADDDLNLLYIMEHDLLNSCKYYRIYGQRVVENLHMDIHLD